MAKVNVGRQGFITKSALPAVSRPRPVYSGLLLLGSGSNGSTTITDSSINNLTISRFGDTQITTSNPPTGMTSSIAFDGTGDYLSITDATLAISTQNFTLEAYIYPTTSITNTRQICGMWGNTPSTQHSYQIGVSNSNNFFMEWTSSTGTYDFAVTPNGSIATNTWTHVAAVRNDTTLTLYVNGVAQATKTFPTSLRQYTGNVFTIGGNALNSQYFVGNFSNVRITIGSVLYTGNFTPPALPMSNAPTPVFALSALLNANQTTDNTSNTNAVDSSTHNLTVSNAAGLVSQTQATPFAAGTGGSFRFDGHGDFLQVQGTNTQLEFGTGDFTIECWFWVPVINFTQMLIDWRTTNPQVTPALYIFSSTLNFNVSNVVRISGGTPLANTWNHVAVVRISGTTRMYLNGAQVGSNYTDSNNYITNANRPTIGNDGPGSLNNYTSISGLRGFISNVRVVKGVGVYTGNFTVPTSPLTATQSAGTNIAAISGTETSLLLNGTNYMVVDSSTNNTKGLAPFGVNYAMTGGQVNFHPYSGSGRYGSYWFDGSFSYIDSPDNADWQITGDMTVEVWIYPTSVGSSTRRIVNQNQDGSAANTSFNLALNSSGTITFDFFQGSSGTAITSSTTVSANTWTHIAVVRSGTAVTMYINGVSRATGTFSGSTNNSTWPLRIGAIGTTNIPTNTVNGLIPSTTVGGAFGVFPGYITGLRIVKGTAVYTGNFTPPSIQPVDVDGATSAASYPSTTNVNTTFSSTDTKLLCKFDRWTVQDNDTLPRPVYLLGTAQTSTAQAKFGAASLNGGSNLGYALTYVAAPMNIGTGNFTIQCWLYTSVWNNPQNQNPVFYTGAQATSGSGANVQKVWIGNNGAVVLDRYGSTATTIGTINTATFTNVWFHFALVRNSGTTTCYINGTSIGSTTAWSGVTVGNLSGIFPGGAYNEGLVYTAAQSGYVFWPGFVDDFNVAPYALYTGNFSAPVTQATDPYPVTPTVTNSVYGAYQNY